MSVSVETGTTLAFDRFWRWIKHHPNCILRAGTGDVYLHDQESFHWHLEEDAERNPVVQLISGKLLVAEMVLDVRDVLYVEATPDPGGEPGQMGICVWPAEGCQGAWAVEGRAPAASRVSAIASAAASR